jgi:hypothetical protein
MHYFFLFLFLGYIYTWTSTLTCVLNIILAQIRMYLDTHSYLRKVIWVGWILWTSCSDRLYGADCSWWGSEDDKLALLSSNWHQGSFCVYKIGFCLKLNNAATGWKHSPFCHWMLICVYKGGVKLKANKQLCTRDCFTIEGYLASRF